MCDRPATRRLVLCIAVWALCSAMPSPAFAQAEVTELSCQGQVDGFEAFIQGQRRFTPTNQVGDGIVEFRGVMRVAPGTVRIEWQGSYAPYPGIIQGPAGSRYISVLDNIGGSRMEIYDAAPSAGPPTLLGRLICR